MPFSSITFIFLFLPISLILFYIIPRKGWRNVVLVSTSLVFFAWADPTHIHVLFISILINYFWGRIIGNALEKDSEKAPKTQLWFGIILNLLLLGFYKYTGFFLTIIENVLSTTIEYSGPSLPIGISFFTFSGISYILDIYNGVNPPERNLTRFSAYLIMFPKLLQGPITRYKQIKESLQEPKFIPLNILQGVRRFIGGLAKKVILADSLSIATNSIFSSDLYNIGAELAWFGLIAYSLQIYLDFSGYTDMAIGVGQMLGMKFPENFDFPYISRSITDFWRRWHITLGAWFRTYLFIPLEFARKKTRHFRQQSNILIVFLLTGLWHGASWNFVIWGLYNGVILAVEASGFGKKLRKISPVFQHSYSLILIAIGWIFFRITEVSGWSAFFGALLGVNGWTGEVTFRSLNILYYIPFLIPALIFSTPFLHNLSEKIKAKGGINQLILDLIYLVLFLFTLTFIISKGFNPFMYVEF
ncbi:MAG: MBOAT family O-acyltransferase [Bacteroidota bacterium]|nr:MBOAT family O-acyltransferase [Bacteroidota bacterium]